MRNICLKAGMQAGLYFVLLNTFACPAKSFTPKQGDGRSFFAAHATQAKRSPKPKTPAPSKRTPSEPPAPATREQQIVRTTRTVLSQILAGKVEPGLLTPALRAKFTAAKVKSLGTSLRAFGPLKTVTLVSRKEPEEGKTTETCILRILFGDTSFIGTLAVTKDNKLDDLQLLEE